MGEVKSVKVDNWGVFFLQKLQNFFNKTDYCDLTLQFNDNSQLKVHRLVLSACTDYFNVLEQTCEVLDDTLVMPRGLQADVVVPIVNFMYTGTLEFEISMYGRLLKTARDMNMTVLLKLLEAHKRTVENSRPQLLAKRAQPAKTFINRRVPSSQAMPIKVEQIYNQPSTSGTRRIPVSSHQYKTLQIKPVAPSTSYYPQIRASEQTSSIVTKYAHSKTPVKGPSRFDCNDDTVLPPDSFEQFDAISYESKPLITANQICKEDLEDYDNLIPAHDTSATFEQLRKSYTNNKRPSSSVSSFESPPEKKPNIQDVKEYAEQQLMRKQIAAEYDDDNEFEDILDDEFHNDDDDEDYVPPASIQKQNKKSAIVIKQDRDQKPTIVVKDTAGSNVNHAKIISEVLKKYPHLVKNNKNIKLKIMAKSSTSPNQNIIIKQESDSEQYGTHSQEIPKSITLNIPKSVTVQNTVSSKSAVQKASISHPAPVKSQAPLSSAPGSKAPIPGTTPRRIDSKTMHALIAKGAENTTGPWLCLRCGINGRPISIPSYRGFRRHLINIHKEKVDPRLCEHCGWRSQNNVELYHHLKVQHDINPPFGFNYPKCEYCSTILLNKTNLALHMKTEHPDKISKQQQCMYCNGMFQDEDVLYNHMHSRHKLRAQKDGLIDYTDDEDDASFYCENPADNKIKILSNITLPQGNIKPGAKISLEQSAGASGLSTVATGIAASLGLIDSSDSQEIQYLEETGFINAGSTTEPKFVNADGHLMELTPEQREEIISQLDNQHEGGVVMLLSQEPFEVKAEQIVSAESGTADSNTAENKEESSEAEVGVFSEDPKPDETKIEIKENESELDESMEWQIDTQSTTESSKEAKSKDDDDAEKEDSEQKDAGEEDNSQVIDESIEENDSKNGEKTEEEKNKIKSAKESLKLLTGDWSDDEEEADDETVAPELEEKQQSEEKEDDIPASKENDDTIESKNNAADSTATIENTEIPENEIIYETVTSIDASSYVEQDKEIEEEEESKKSECIEKQLTDEEQSEDKSMDVEDDVKGDEEVDTKAVDGVKIKEEHTKSEIEEIVKENEKNRKKSISKNESGDEKDEEEEKSDGKIKTDSTQKESGGDPIRSLISDWGDDDDDDDDEEL